MVEPVNGHDVLPPFRQRGAYTAIKTLQIYGIVHETVKSLLIN